MPRERGAFLFEKKETVEDRNYKAETNIKESSQSVPFRFE